MSGFQKKHFTRCPERQNRQSEETNQTPEPRQNWELWEQKLKLVNILRLLIEKVDKNARTDG